MTNKAFILVKPSAFTEYVYKILVPKILEKNEIKITRSGIFTPQEMETKIDGHYSSISHHAMKFDKEAVSLIAQKAFLAAFGIDWNSAVVNGVDGGYKVEDWRNLEKLGQTAKLEDGLYCGRIGENQFIVNGFYPAMRRQYTEGNNAFWYEVEFEMDYQTFKNDVIGATNPVNANPGSLRSVIFGSWKNLGLARQPSIGENGIHGSATAEDAYLELKNWL
jgi:nucleoside diphosphate kinase